MPVRNRGIILNQFLTIYEERVQLKVIKPDPFFKTYTLYGTVSLY